MSRKSLTFLCLLAALIAVPGLATEPPAEEAAPVAAAPESQTEVEAAPGVAGMRVFKDQETGQFRAPTAEERRAMAQELQSMISRSSEGLEQVRGPGGAVLMNLQGRFQHVYMVRRTDDGQLERTCTTHEHALTHPAAAPADQLEEE